MDKATCVRVVYADGHHIDLPSYWIEKDGDTPQLIHKSKGFVESDPKAFKAWVDGEISSADSNGQLRSVIRYFKAWRDFREDRNKSLRLPSGFILTILVCNHFSSNNQDDLAFKNTAESILDTLQSIYECYRPTAPTDEDLLESYSEKVFINELSVLVTNAKKAVDSDGEREASEIWCKVFGKRFPLGKNPENKVKNSSNVSPNRTSVSFPWSTC